ncbi:TetR/AcrR family transcriptional regulator [Actinophytocola algeriensis]|uniref:AcrR family transcriptional regulator n=1 Tax=Actinophytocola algeriensis TaxID=1768010 RepID=A0A7W7VHA4_9PSEU|nr:TetR/AcrR family transcriptional regulator [Actinophytocola algeriensis]MBB4910004.1 AcrR family transcriptional regulator [Actinophytocola algeriensis]MBE1475994.1 AcrR family transcriptional regulator [Actinophytocola algeriensis]
MAEISRPPVRRPRNRKAQLADAAAELFRKHGYHQVSVNDIAKAAGVTGPAVYRHFRGKQDILAHVLLSGMDTFGLVTEGALATPGTPAGQLSALLRAVAELAVDRREITALWRWEGRHLAEADRTKIRHRGAELMAQWGIALRDARPELAMSDAELLCWATLSVYGSLSDHHTSPPRRRFEDLLVTLATAVTSCRVPDGDPVPLPEPLPERAPGTPGSRREELLTAAISLFRERGYAAVSMEDIGARAGMAGPSIYRYFPGKAAILVAGGYRMSDQLARTATHAMTLPPQEALTYLATSYVDTVLRSDNIMATFANELRNLPERDRKDLVRLQRHYVGHWYALLRTVAPDLPEPDTRVIVHVALTIVNDLARTPRLLRRPRIAAELTELAVTVLDAGR